MTAAKKKSSATKRASRPLVDDAQAEEDRKVLEEITKYPMRLERDVPLAKLVDWPGNPKDHDIGAISESMQRNGSVDPIIALDLKGKPHYIISGHGRKETYLAHGMKTAPYVLYVQMPLAAARRHVLAANRTQERGGWQPDALLSFMTSISDDLMGTGFDRDDIDDLHSRIHGNDDVGNATKGAVGNVKFQIVVTCDGEDHQRELVEEFEGRRLKCRLLTL